MDRREFLKRSALISAALATSNIVEANDILETAERTLTPEGSNDEQHSLLISSPMLQNYAETSIGVAFAVSAMANGYVIYGEK